MALEEGSGRLAARNVGAHQMTVHESLGWGGTWAVPVLGHSKPKWGPESCSWQAPG